MKYLFSSDLSVVMVFFWAELNLLEMFDIQHKDGGFAQHRFDRRGAAIIDELDGLIDLRFLDADHQRATALAQKTPARGNAGYEQSIFRQSLGNTFGIFVPQYRHDHFHYHYNSSNRSISKLNMVARPTSMDGLAFPSGE